MKNNDAALIQRALDGDDTAFSALVRKYQRSVHALAWRKVGDFHIAEDITQDTLLKAYQRLSTLKEPQRFASWLYVITANQCKAWLRKNRKWTQTLEDTSSAQLEKATYSEYVIAENERMTEETQREVVKKLLAKLQESDRTVITLYYLGGMTYEEISEFLGVSEAAIRNRLYRARHRLKKEEPMIREALENFQITPNLTENIMREVARLKPIAPSGGKPLVPWGTIGVSTVAVVLLMLGVSSQYLARFQKPYNFDAASEMTVEIIEAPVVLNLESKPDVRTQLGGAAVPSQNAGTSQQPDAVLFAAAQADGEDVSVPKQQWIQSEPVNGTAVQSFFATPEGDLYTHAKGELYKLPANEETWQHIFDVWTLPHSGLGLQLPIAKWSRTLYYIQSSELFASADDGKTWDLLYAWDRDKYWDSIALILTEQAFYMAFSNGVFSSEDTGKTWKAINDGLVQSIRSLVKVQNTLFAGTENGFYRLDSDGWKRLKLPMPIGGVSSVAVSEDRLFVLAELSWDVLDPRKVSRGLQRGWGIFRSNDLGTSWKDITPTNAWIVNGFIPEAKLIATGETLLLIERRMVRSTDGGNTWLPPQLPGTTPFMDSYSPAVVLNTGAIYIGSWDGLHRSTDGGKSWEIVNITSSESGIDNLVVFKEPDKDQNLLSTLYGKVGVDVVKTIDGGNSWVNVPVEIPMTKSHREQDPRVNHIVKSDGVIYAGVDYQENGEKVRLYRVAADDRTFVPIQGMPFFDSGELKRRLPQNLFVEKLQEKYSGATQFFKHLVQGDDRKQNELIRMGLRGAFAVSGDTFYMEYNFKLFRWEPGDTEWYDTELEETVELTLDLASRELKLAASGNAVYVGKRDGHLVVSFDRGTNWLNLTPALPFAVKAFHDIVFVGTTVYVATDAGVAASSDGKEWRAITDAAGTPLIIGQLAVDGTKVYGVSKSGVYRLENNTWKEVVSEIPNSVTSLAVDGNVLYVGTQGSGMLHFNLDE
ncbi:MAG: sigma-70 family RNA polymerase sigma factor [Candidatus Poribacteria bacterium]|nr:sigma-70 family RNA polymerase sigma factor [Candidatus Poribacteria bacterium]